MNWSDNEPEEIKFDDGEITKRIMEARRDLRFSLLTDAMKRAIQARLAALEKAQAERKGNDGNAK